MVSEKDLLEYKSNLESYENELKKAQEKLETQQMMMSQYASQVYSLGGKQNLIEWELDFSEEIEKIAHSLRCDIWIIDKEGNQYWIENPDKSKVILNELGVNDILRKIVTLVNKNKTLSYYTIDEIKERVRMIGHEISALIYKNYEAYGIDNEYKMNNYSSLVLDILDIIESAYRRALGGETHKGLNEQRIVTQTEPLMPPQKIQNTSDKVKWYNPATWGG